MGWDRDQVKKFAQSAKENAGKFWDLVGPEIREALIARRALDVVRDQNAETQRTDDIRELYRGMLSAAGLAYFE